MTEDEFWAAVEPGDFRTIYVNSWKEGEPQTVMSGIIGTSEIEGCFTFTWENMTIAGLVYGPVSAPLSVSGIASVV